MASRLHARGGGDAWLIVALLVIALALLFLGGCGPEYPKSRYGIKLTDQTDSVRIEDVDAGVDAVLAVIGGKGQRLQGLRLNVEGKPLSCPWMGGQGICAGLSYLDWNYTRVWKDTPCWARTAWVHELCHWFQLWREGVDDPGHADPRWWTAPDSVEGRAYHIAIMAACPDTP